METNKKCPLESNGDFHSIEEAQSQMNKVMESEYSKINSEQDESETE